MRRAQVDEWSQPVRNLAGNPAMINASGSTIIRTNLALNPRMISTGFINGYQQQSLTAVTGISGHPDGITTAYRVNYVAGNVNPGIVFTNGLESSTQYTVSAWVYQEGTAGTVALALKGQASSPSTSTTAGTWQRLTWTMTSAAGLVAGNDFAARLTGTAAGSGSFLVTEPLVEKSPTVGTYFDGGTAAAGDFSYAWTGTSNNSTSIQTAVNISTVSASRNTNVLDSKFFYYSSTAEDGKKTVKWVSPAGTANSGWRVASINASSILGWNYAPIKAGGRYTLMMRYRASGWGASQGVQIMIAEGSAQNAVVGFDTTQPLTNSGWQDYRRTFTAVRDATNLSQIYMSLPVTPQATTDGIFEIREWMLVEGEYTGDFIDGTQPFSKWDGTANASTSVGYPQQLTDLAGKPSLDLFSSGASVNSGGVAIPVGALDARTVYIVYEAWNNTQNYPNFASYGVMSSKGVTFQTGPAGGTTLFPRFDLPGGSSNVGVSLTGGRKFARHVLAMSFPAGLTSVTSILDGSADRTDALTPGTGWDDGRAALQGTFTDGRGIRILVFYAEHDRATRLAVSRHLGNKYGALVA